MPRDQAKKESESKGKTKSQRHSQRTTANKSLRIERAEAVRTGKPRNSKIAKKRDQRRRFATLSAMGKRDARAAGERQFLAREVDGVMIRRLPSGDTIEVEHATGGEHEQEQARLEYLGVGQDGQPTKLKSRKQKIGRVKRSPKMQG